MDALCWVEEWLWYDQRYVIRVHRRDGGTYMAETLLRPGDKLISDGDSIESVLRTHKAMLPLALMARATLEQV